MRTPRRAPALLLAVPLLLAGCDSPSGAGAGGPSSSSAASGAATATTPTGGHVTSGSAGAWGSMAGCPSVGRALPPGVTSAPTVDVDGDGRPDTAFIATQPDAQGGTAFGVRTASGGVFSASTASGSPIPRSVLFADVTGHGEVIALASDGRQVQLWAVSRCSLEPVRNVEGQQYAFDLGFTGHGTGVGCVDADGNGTRDLVGLRYVPEAHGAGTIRRTIVTLQGTQARNGATDTVPVTRAGLADEARAVSCGDVSLAQNGVSSAP